MNYCRSRCFCCLLALNSLSLSAGSKPNELGSEECCMLLGCCWVDAGSVGCSQLVLHRASTNVHIPARLGLNASPMFLCADDPSRMTLGAFLLATRSNCCSLLHFIQPRPLPRRSSPRRRPQPQEAGRLPGAVAAAGQRQLLCHVPHRGCPGGWPCLVGCASGV